MIQVVPSKNQQSLAIFIFIWIRCRSRYILLLLIFCCCRARVGVVFEKVVVSLDNFVVHNLTNILYCYANNISPILNRKGGLHYYFTQLLFKIFTSIFYYALYNLNKIEICNCCIQKK